MTKIIILNNRMCKLEPDAENIGLLLLIRKYLSYKAIGVEYTPAYRNGWDGITYLMDKKGMVPIGLLHRVENYLKDQNIRYSIEDKRIRYQFGKPIDISKKLAELGKIPRDYQTAILETTKNHDRGIIRACTGAGKSLSIAMCVAEHTAPTIIFVIGLSLLNQFHETLSSIFEEEIGYVGNSICNIKRITVCSVWTAAKSLDVKNIILDDELSDDIKETFNQNNKFNIINMLKEAKFVGLDECHSCTCETLKSIFKFIEPEKCFGFSATPYRDDGSDLTAHAYLGEQIINITASELIKRKVLTKPYIKFVSVPQESASSRTYMQIYSQYVVENDIRNALVANETKNLVDKKYKVLVLFKNIKHGKILAKLLTERNLRFEILSGKDNIERRLEVQRQLENNEIDIILGSKIFQIGIDLPILSGLVLAGGGRSSIAIIQSVGRILRSYPGKKNAAVVDFHDNIKYLKQHSKIRYRLYKAEPGFEVLPNNFFK